MIVLVVAFDASENSRRKMGRLMNSALLPSVFAPSLARPPHSKQEFQNEIAALKREVARLKRSFSASERKLRQAQKLAALGHLSSGISHDFNNILTVITGTIDILTDGVADKPELVAVAKLINQAAGRGAGLTRHLLSVARDRPLEKIEIDLNRLVADTVKLLEPTLGKHIRVMPDFDVDTHPVSTDPSQLTAALLNLALNARDAMPQGGELALRTCNVVIDGGSACRDLPPGHYIMLEVSDNGIGIPAAIRHRVFEPFFTTKNAGHGNGLGLSMVRGFVEQCGGGIEIDSEVGKGTTVRLYLPRA